MKDDEQIPRLKDLVKEIPARYIFVLAFMAFLVAAAIFSTLVIL